MAKKGFKKAALAAAAALAFFHPSMVTAKNPQIPSGIYEPYDPEELYKRINQLVYTQELDNAAWVKGANCTVVANQAMAPDGTMTADKVTFDADVGTADIIQTFSGAVVGQPYNVSIWLWNDIGQAAAVNFFLADGGSGTITSSTPALSAVATRVSVTGIATSTSIRIRLRIAGASNANKYFYAWGAQLSRSSDLFTYQRVTDWFTEYLAQVGNRVMLFQDPECRTPCVKAEDPVGCCLDFRFRGQRGSQIIPDIDFNDSSKWAFTQPTAGSVTVSGGVCRINSTDGTLATANVAVAATVEAIVPNKYYAYQIDVTAVAAGSVTVAIGGASSSTITATGKTSGILRATDTSNPLIRRSSGVTDVTITSFVVQEVFGIPWTQSSTPSKFLLSARYNKIIQSEDIGAVGTTTYWNKTNLTSVTSGAAGPDGRTNFNTILENTTNGQHAFFGNNSNVFTVVAGEDIAWGGVFKYNGRRLLLLLANSTFTNYIRGIFDLQTGTVVLSGVGGSGVVLQAPTIESLGNGFYRCTIYGKVDTGSTQARGGVYTVVDGTTTDTFAGDVTKGIIAGELNAYSYDDWLKQIPRYQRIGTSAVDLDTGGFPYYFLADGTDDFAVTPTIAFGNSKVISHFIGFTKQTDAAVGVVVEGALAPGWGGIFAPASATGNNFSFRAYGGTANNTGVGAAVDAAPVSRVLNVKTDNSNGNADGQIRVHVSKGYRTLTGTSLTDNVALADSVLYWGRRGGTSLPVKGRYYFMMFAATEYSLAEQKEITNYINRKMAMPYANA